MPARVGATHVDCPPPDRLAWVAGFWDGEGCVTTLTSYATPQFHLSQAGDEGAALCQRVLDWSGVNGHVHGPYSNGKDKPYWRVRITGYTAVSILAERCWPWLSDTKRTQYERAIERWWTYRTEHGVNDWRTRTTCRNGHDLTGDNLRITPKGWRRCKACHRESEAARRTKLRTQPALPATR